MTLVLPYTATSDKHFDAIPVMSNFFAIRDVINGNLDESNFDPTMSPTFSSLSASSQVEFELIQPTGSIEFCIPEGKVIDFSLADNPLTKYVSISESGVTI